MKTEALLALDRQHIWHPYTAIPAQPEPYPVASAEGVYLTLTDGRRLIDGMSSWWSVIHGYNHPRLNQVAHAQIEQMAHVMFGGLTHEPAAELVKRLLQITPPALDQVFLADSGSVSVEVALKMAIQYWQAQGKAAKHRFLAFKGGYHGDTFGAMSVCDPENGMHHLFTGVLPQHYFAPRPEIRFHQDWRPEAIDEFARLLQQNHQHIAAVILEPIVQGAGGMWFYHLQYLREIRQLCDEYQVLLIADEIATGFGRSGRLLACEHAGVTPDLLCLGKALTGGYMTLAATLTTRAISQQIAESEAHCFMHGPTFMANPLACRVACSSLDVLLESDWQQTIQRIENRLATGLAPCRDLSNVADVRVLGAIGVVEMKQALDVGKIQSRLVEQGVWLRPFGRLLYTMPPYIMTDDQLDTVCQALYQSIA
ncbi:adenosylmethionine--8-amino-7-oxononanoate transaminase [methane-oxidizing endosymbiont of Gigantopelta aegis]|uniref:adenosylmethionine--8-amino-7-oxononanoate transaminase n=1 Tax=methane-oxidizing endosymbiont of Gigantopelta aegis TaxID=2794938 RepID=UPI0018DD3BBC|nr:adenosylmethionine--8-amino-7-oxononanoate transaminase [methane-oxidizing endosymbiont of Gigantopelta aegis]